MQLTLQPVLKFATQETAMGTILYIGFAYKLQAFWHEWNIRIFVLLSEFLQLVLYFLMPYRKSTSNPYILLVVNATYVVSFTAASTALAYISSGMPDKNGYQPPLVLWASFMLLHLAGVGQTIANTVDDSKMWYRRFVNFIIHDLVIFIVITLQWHQVAVPGGWALVAMAAYVGSFLQMKLLWLGRSDSRVKHFLHPKAAGWLERFKKYRLVSKAFDCYHSCFTSSERQTPEQLTSSEREKSRLEETGQKAKEFDECDEFELVSKAFKYYHSTRKLIPGLSFTTSEREDSRSDFLRLGPKVAVRIVEIELNMAYDAYFTNGFDPPKEKNLRGLYLLLRLIYHTSVLALFTTLGIRISFLSLSDLKDKYNSRDKLITRLLCFSTVLLNLLALLKFLSSDYVIASWGMRRLAQLPHKRRWWSSDAIDDHAYLKSLARIFFRRWSETLTRRSFRTECQREAAMRSSSLPRIIVQRYLAPSTFDTQWYCDDVGKFIFTHLKEKAESSISETAAQKIFESKGDGVLGRQRKTLDLASFFLNSPYDLRLLLWHIATDILYNTVDHYQGIDPRTDECREMSNLLSEYMTYLVFERRHIMPTLRGNFIVRYLEISTYLRKSNQVNNGEMKRPMVLQKADKIAEKMKKLEKKEMWEVVSEVWVELLAYAATHCDPIAHVQTLAAGGELITIVWLLSAHLGFGDYFISEEEEKNLKALLNDFRR